LKNFLFFLVCLHFFSCHSEKGGPSFVDKSKESLKRVTTPELQIILDSSNVSGAILIYDEEANQYFSNDFVWSEKGQLPASTFKIPNSIIALETEIVANDSTLFKWDGNQRAFKIWEQDLIFRNAFKFSCVPCYQKIAREIGVDRMKEYLDKLNYGNIQVDSTTLDNFWLIGSSRITPFQEIDFLKRLYHSQLPISKRTENLVKSILVLERKSNYILSGKTGWTYDSAKNNGWFVGFLETKNKVYFFATNIEPNPTLNIDLFPKTRKEVTYKALQKLKIIKNIE
jgi:Beta-lactamase class D